MAAEVVEPDGTTGRPLPPPPFTQIYEYISVLEDAA